LEHFAFDFRSNSGGDDNKLKWDGITGYNIPVVYSEIPVIKHWKGSFNYNFKWLAYIPYSGKMTLEINNVTARAATSYKATSHGRVYP
jgi:hypothetical protein